MYVPDVAAFQKLSFKKADSWICTGKLKVKNGPSLYVCVIDKKASVQNRSTRLNSRD